MHIIVYCRYIPVSFSYMYIVAFTCMNTYVYVYTSVLCVVIHQNSLCQYCVYTCNVYNTDIHVCQYIVMYENMNYIVSVYVDVYVSVHVDVYVFMYMFMFLFMQMFMFLFM